VLSILILLLLIFGFLQWQINRQQREIDFLCSAIVELQERLKEQAELTEEVRSIVASSAQLSDKHLAMSNESLDVLVLKPGEHQ
jgi:Tfp pilus assembly protein PilN